MIGIALSIVLTAQPQPQPQQQQQQNRAIDLAVFLAGSSLAVAYCWKWVMDDSQNQPPKLSIVSPPEPANPEIEHYAEPAPVPFAEPQENAQQTAADAPQFPDIDWDAEPRQTPAQAAQASPPVQLELESIRNPYNLSLKPIPGEVDVELIRAIPLEERIAWLSEYLEENNLLYLLKFVKATPIAVVGMERCGKNTLAMTIAALRRIYYPMPMIACSPHANLDNPFPAFFPQVGYSGEADYRAIAAQLRGLRRWVDLGDTTPVTTFWDEASSYPVKFRADDKPLLTGFTLFCMSECAKHKKYQIISASGTTNKCLPGAEGTANDRDKAIVTVFRHVNEDMLGDKFPSSEIVVESPSGRSEQVFPKWMNANWIMRLFPEVNRAIELPSHLAEVCRVEPEITTAPEVPTTVPSVATFTTPEVLEVKASNVIYLPTSSLPTSTPIDPRKLLFNAVQTHLKEGKSPTWTVENVLGMKGRKFSEGKQFLEQLIKEFGEQAQ